MELALILMVILRLCSGMVELAVAGLMMKSGSIESALLINTVPAFVGPTIFIISMAIGVSELSGKISWSSLMVIVSGLGLMIYGLQRG